MRRKRLWLGLFLLIVLVTPVFGAEPATITIGTFNLQKLGKTESPARIQKIAAICKGVDLLAVEEVAEEGDGVRDLANALGKEYRWSVSKVTTHERFGLIWRYPVELTRPCRFAPGLNLGRKPFTGFFRAGNFDFQVLVVHLFWEGSKKTYPHTRGVELKLLDDWLCYRKSRELDLLILGDFNEPNMYYGFVNPPPRSFHEMFYELLSRHNLISVSLEKRVPTSIMNKNIYDHIIFNPAHYFTEEFFGMEGVSIIQWDKGFDANGNGSLDWAEYEQARDSVTDHRPVFAKFRIDLPDDDNTEK